MFEPHRKNSFFNLNFLTQSKPHEEKKNAFVSSLHFLIDFGTTFFITIFLREFLRCSQKTDFFEKVNFDFNV